MELEGQDNTIVRQYAWGLDLAGQNGNLNSLEAAGGIGGLLAVHDATYGGGSDFVYFYDGNGNVGQLVAWSDIDGWQSLGLNSAQDWHVSRLAAAYQYDPYGAALSAVGYDPATQQLSISGPEVVANRFRFSTKQWDPETGWGYWGVRYLDAPLGRWTSEDPIGEQGGVHLYQYGRNAPTSLIDPSGMKPKWAALTSIMSRNGAAWLIIADGVCTETIGVSIDGVSVVTFHPEEITQCADNKTYLKLVDVNNLGQTGTITLWWTERCDNRRREVTLNYTSTDKTWHSSAYNLTYALAENVGVGTTFSDLWVPYREWPAAHTGAGEPVLSMGTFGKFLESAHIIMDNISAAGDSGRLSISNVSSAYGEDSSLSEATLRQLKKPDTIGPKGDSSGYAKPSILVLHAERDYYSLSGKWFFPFGGSGWSASVRYDAYVFDPDLSGGSRTPVWGKSVVKLALPGQPLPEDPPPPPVDGIILP